ncbi:uncharacterized protein [Lolium perenne]|uniref:uncharacterized protein n=1 Tax=Lolium perenne TaxID=4522 RepID=UPI0021F5E431|nr:uncharacterized protein LOC127348388 [Lolium perenne]
MEQDPSRMRNHLCDAACFHSRPVSRAKWMAKWDSKKYERYVVRKKRAAGKKALKDYLCMEKPTPHIQKYERCVVRQRRAERKKAMKDYLLYGKVNTSYTGWTYGQLCQFT